jgi:hypothetical protein
MNAKKILVSSSLALSLLVTAIPAFASTGNTSSPSSQSAVSPQALVDNYIYKTENVFANSYTENGITWYLKGITYSSGYYIGHYQANI